MFCNRQQIIGLLPAITLNQEGPTSQSPGAFQDSGYCLEPLLHRNSFEMGASLLSDFITTNRGQLTEVTTFSYSESLSESLGDLVRRGLDLVESMLLFS